MGHVPQFIAYTNFPPGFTSEQVVEAVPNYVPLCIPIPSLPFIRNHQPPARFEYEPCQPGEVEMRVPPR